MASEPFMESRLRRATRRQVAGTFVAAALLVGLLVAFFGVYGDPAGPNEPGKLDIEVIWNTDGTVTATIATPFASLAENERVAAAMVPAVLGESTEVRTHFPEDKGGTRSIEARTIDAVAPPTTDLELSTAELSAAADRIAMTEVDLALSVPQAHPVVQSPTPTSRIGSWYQWNDVRSSKPIEISVDLHPDVTGWVVGTTVTTVLIVAALAIAASTDRRARNGDLPERRARRWYGIGLGVTAAALVWSLRLEMASDNPTVAWGLAGTARYIARWGLPLGWLALGVSLVAASGASYARDGVRRRFPPPPPRDPSADPVG